MSGFNRVLLGGYIGADPKIAYTPEGVCVANFSLATPDKIKDKDTKKLKEHTEWHLIVCYDRIAEFCGKYLKKGYMVYIEGTIRTNAWTDKSGNKRHQRRIIVTSFPKILRRKYEENVS